MFYYILMISLNLLITFLFINLDKKTKFSSLNPHLKQLLIGVCFGAMGILATQSVSIVKVPLSNVRDSFTLTAGLLFGGEAGIISSIISAAFRFFSPTIIGGEFTQLSCTITTLVAGLAAALMRWCFFKKRCPTLLLSFSFTICIEAFHMAMIFLTHSSELSLAFLVVKQACLKVMIANSLSVMLAVLVYRLCDFSAFKKIYLKHERNKGISKSLIFSLSAFLTIAFCTVGYFLYYTHTRYSENSLNYIFDGCITEIEDNLKEMGNLITQDEVIDEVDSYYAYMIDDVLLVDRVSGYIYNYRDENIQYFPLEHKGEEGKLYETYFDEECYYYMYRPFGKYLIVPVVLKEDITFFRDSTIYMVGLLNVIIFSIIFFIAYVLLKTFVISNLRKVIEQTMKAKGEDVTRAEDITPKYFMPMSEELNYTFRLLYKNNTELTGKIQEEHKKTQRYEYLADHDKLTHIYNREGFKKRVMDGCIANKNIAFIFIDVDKFKDINDTYGHQTGDAILQKIVREMKHNTRSDDILMRYGGDEFAMILMGCTDSEEVMISKKIDIINHALLETSDDLPPTTISAGCAFSLRGYSEEVLREADKALYVTKENGRGKCSFSKNIIV